MRILGSGAKTIVEGGGVGTVVRISATATVTLGKLTMRNGFSYNGGGISNLGTLTVNNVIITGNGSINPGGGIVNEGTLTLNNSVVSVNSSSAAGARNCAAGGILNDGTLVMNYSSVVGNSTSCGGITFSQPVLHANGGGIYNTGHLVISKSSVRENTASVETGCQRFPPHCTGAEAAGGGILNAGTLTLSQSTLSANLATARATVIASAAGGGIANNLGATATITDSTLYGNRASAGEGSSAGGGIDNAGTLTVSSSTLSGNGAGSGGGASGATTFQNTIVANSTSGGNCSASMTSHGYNLSSDGTCVFTGPGDMNNTDPMLGPLQNNGGPTLTMALLLGSPAIDAGNPSGCTDGLGHLLKTDQRGRPRPDTEDKTGCDMGAYERQSD